MSGRDAEAFLRSIVDRVAERSPSEESLYSMGQWKARSCAMSQREVAKLFGVTRAMIHNIEKRALAKLRAALLADEDESDA